MKIYTLGSNAFTKKMVQMTDDLIAIGVDAFISQHYRDLAAGKLKEFEDKWNNDTGGEKAKLKIEHDFFNFHYKHILGHDAVLIVNETKNEIENYIGGNVLIEMGQAYVNGKKIFLLNGLPTDKRIMYLDEIYALQPICLEGNLENIKKYI